MVATLSLNLIYEGHDLIFVFTFFLLFLLKVSLSLAVLMSLVGQLPFLRVMRALFDLKLSPLLIFITMLMYRYVEVLQEEWGRMDLARKMREGNLQHSYAKYKQIPLYAKMIGVLFIRTVDRAERVSIAMKARGWSGEFDCQQLDKYLRQLKY
jgi:cobalt/nickel transport system permease protein